MDNTVYAALNRQVGLFREMNIVANNLANMSTTGYRREAIVFSEFLHSPGSETGSLSIAHANGQATDLSQAGFIETGRSLDMAIDGDGFFLIQNEFETYLTRSGPFVQSANGNLVTPNGDSILDFSSSPIQIPGGIADLTIANDGTISGDGNPITRVGIWLPTDLSKVNRVDGVGFQVSIEDTVPSEDYQIRQGFLERSNVEPVEEVSRMIEVQRTYELGQSFLEKEDERIRNLLRTLGQR